MSGVRELDGYRVFQISAPISKGSSGGPVFNDKGEVIGVAVFLLEGGQSLNFAVPVDYVRGMLAMNAPVRGLEALKDDSQLQPAPEVSSSKPESAVPKQEPAPVRTAAVSTDDIRKAGLAPFLLRQVGVWTADDAKNTIGDPVNHRYGYDQNKNIISNIYMYRDPLGTGPNFEIAFGSKTEKMSAAFLYPVGITWDQVKKMWGDDVNVVKNPDGTKFHNYKNARVNVKVDKNSNVMGIVVY